MDPWKVCPARDSLAASEHASMKQLIDEAVFAEAFAYGRRSTFRLMHEHAVLYAAMGVAFAGLLAWGAQGATNVQFNPGAFITFPALAAAVRLVRPDYRMRFRTVMALVGIALLTFSPIILSGGTALLFSKGSATSFSIGGLLSLLLFILFFAYVWILVKFSAAWTFYALREGEGGSIFKALAESWAFLSGDMWWRVVGLAIAIGFMCELLPTILASVLFLRMGFTSSFLSIFIWALVVYVAAVPATIWLQAAYVALISASGQQNEPAGGIASAAPVVP